MIVIIGWGQIQVQFFNSTTAFRCDSLTSDLCHLLKKTRIHKLCFILFCSLCLTFMSAFVFRVFFFFSQSRTSNASPCNMLWHFSSAKHVTSTQCFQSYCHEAIFCSWLWFTTAIDVALHRDSSSDCGTRPNKRRPRANHKSVHRRADEQKTGDIQEGSGSAVFLCSGFLFIVRI